MRYVESTSQCGPLVCVSLHDAYRADFATYVAAIAETQDANRRGRLMQLIELQRARHLREGLSEADALRIEAEES